MKKYLILNQLGTPDEPTAEAVGEYLKEFLMDPNVITLPRPFRDLLVKGLIVPRRKSASAAKYQKIWMDSGSPLAVYTERLQKKLQQALPSDWEVLVGMRYGSPSLADAFSQVPQDAERIVYLPLYPHHARATVGSAIDRMSEVASHLKVQVLPPFYQREWYIEALSHQIGSSLTSQDHLLLSYHGLPKSQDMDKGISYQQQCYQTSADVRRKLGLSESQVSTAFQSRLGPKKWLEPSTEEMMLRLVGSGIRHLKVACPSFVADCLETLEEIGLELRKEFLAHGGESFELIPCLNDSDMLVQGLRQELQN
ncbi:ferrochelatase [Pseudobdellovibrio exovorus]|uniref:Ferrochelatase n=1 Tax=Pseudobdellovibrio exovorus JSS TaxID=1184267 RepID=M4VBM4_9BACT|nr:ferrochelatase [Pseudobdellovibrio exovorus]AGH95885.1 ferrochelatase [Pseudobdellovibrio exovorus JSS]